MKGLLQGIHDKSLKQIAKMIILTLAWELETFIFVWILFFIKIFILRVDIKCILSECELKGFWYLYEYVGGKVFAFVNVVCRF